MRQRTKVEFERGGFKRRKQVQRKIKAEIGKLEKDQERLQERERERERIVAKERESELVWGEW
jgi:hypothetical protein